MNIFDFSGYILAGGKSSRMKTDKAFLETGGETFLTHAVQMVSSVCEKRVKVVLNQTQSHIIEKLPENIPYIFDVYANRGALGGIHAALQNCETKYAFILAVDLPLVTGEVVTKLVEIGRSSNKFLAVVPRQTDGKIQPLCAVYHARYCLRTLEQLMDKNDSASVRNFLDLISTRYVGQNKLSEDDNIFFNINSPADFQAIK